MPKRKWDHGAVGVTENSRQKVQANIKWSARSMCQACALQIPTFFCDWDCDGSGSKYQWEEVSRIFDEQFPLPLAAQDVGHENPQQEHAKAFASPASTVTDTSTGTTRSSESCLASPSANGCFNWPTDVYDFDSLALASHTLMTQLKQPEDRESPSARCLDSLWQESSQFRYSTTGSKTMSTTSPNGSTIQANCGEHRLEHNVEHGAEAYDLYGDFNEPITATRDEEEILQVDCIVQRLAKLDRCLRAYAKQQLRITECDIVGNDCQGLTKGEFAFSCGS